MTVRESAIHVKLSTIAICIAHALTFPQLPYVVDRELKEHEKREEKKNNEKKKKQQHSVVAALSNYKKKRKLTSDHRDGSATIFPIHFIEIFYFYFVFVVNAICVGRSVVEKRNGYCAEGEERTEVQVEICVSIRHDIIATRKKKKYVRRIWFFFLLLSAASCIVRVCVVCVKLDCVSHIELVICVVRSSEDESIIYNKFDAKM